MNKLTQNEIDTAKDIISLGLNKAAQSLSFFMKETITLKKTDFSMSNEQNIELRYINKDVNLFVLSTEIKGELKGICYLVMNEEEKNEVCRVALPAEIVNDPEKLKYMQEPLLLEIDNIISASVITQLVNHLKQKMYGDVPHLTVMSANQLQGKIREQMKPDKLIIGFQTEFISSNNYFHPEFYWILDNSFTDAVKHIISEPMN